MGTVGVRIEGLSEFSAWATKMANKGTEKRKVLKEIGLLVQQYVRSRFDREESPEGEKWKPLQPETLDAKARKGGSSKILTQTQKLRDSIHSVIQGWGDREILYVIPGENIPYAAAHQYGRKEIDLAARPYMGYDEDTEQEMKEIVVAWLMDGGTL